MQRRNQFLQLFERIHAFEICVVQTERFKLTVASHADHHIFLEKAEAVVPDLISVHFDMSVLIFDEALSIVSVLHGQHSLEKLQSNATFFEAHFFKCVAFVKRLRNGLGRQRILDLIIINCEAFKCFAFLHKHVKELLKTLITQFVCGQIDILEACHLWQNTLNHSIQSMITKEVIRKVEYF